MQSARLFSSSHLPHHLGRLFRRPPRLSSAGSDVPSEHQATGPRWIRRLAPSAAPPAVVCWATPASPRPTV